MSDEKEKIDVPTYVVLIVGYIAFCAVLFDYLDHIATALEARP